MRYRAASLVVVALLVASVAASCGTSQGAATGSRPVQPAPTPSVTPSSTRTTLPGIGESVDFEGNSWPNMNVVVTPLRTLYEGQQTRDWGVEVNITNQGQESYTENFTSWGLVPSPATLWGTDGEAYRSDPNNWDYRNDSPSVLERIHVLPGASVTGWIVFGPVPNNWEPESFEFAPTNSGLTGEWELPTE